LLNLKFDELPSYDPICWNCATYQKRPFPDEYVFDFENIFKKLIFFSGQACSVVLRGATQQILDEAERSLHDALCVLTTHVRDKRVVPGAGASEMLTATAVMSESQKVGRKRGLKEK